MEGRVRIELKMIEKKTSPESPAAKIKIWGDALMNTISRMPSEGIDVVSWFVSVEKLFEQLSVPAELQSILIRPYFSERAKLLMSKCDPFHDTSYESIKKNCSRSYIYLHLCISTSLMRLFVIRMKLLVTSLLDSHHFLNIMSRVGKWTTVMINWLI